MRRRLIGTAKCGDIAVRYYLLEECTQETVVYGIEVECGGECARLCDLTSSLGRMRSLAEGLVRGGGHAGSGPGCGGRLAVGLRRTGKR